MVVLTENIEAEAARDLLGASRTGVGYLLKTKLRDVQHLIDAVRKVAAGGTAVDTDLLLAVARLERRHDPLVHLTQRELDVLQLVVEEATTRSPEGSSSPNTLWRRTSATSSARLRLSPAPENERRVMAALIYASRRRTSDAEGVRRTTG